MSLRQKLIALDQLANTFYKDGKADETISARAYREGWKRRQAFFNWLFSDPDHCKASYESELRREHLPPEYRKL